MTRLHQIIRLLRINHVLMRHGLLELVLATHLYRPFTLLFYCNPYNWTRTGEKTRGMRIRKALEDLGPIFVKFGQILSTRRDLLPDDIADELAYLQDQVPPFDGIDAKSIVEQSLACPLSNRFSHFDDKPLASASVAQVHAATLKTGEDVVVKVLRPGIEKSIKRDVSLLYTIAGLIERYWPEGRRLHARDIVAEFEHSLMGELDLQREAANASQLRRNFSGNALLHVPQVYWDYTSRRVMVLERIYGIPVTDVSTLKKHNTNLKLLAERGVEIFFTQVFRDCFFHADMHPGNIFVDIEDPDNPTYVGVDFGIMGTLSQEDQRYLAENLWAFFNRDYKRVAQLHVESGWIPAHTRVEEFESAIRSVCEPVFERPLKDISFGQMLLRLFQTARRFEMEVQPQLLLLQKTLLNVEGLGRQLYPDLNLWDTAKPFLERWMKQRHGMSALFRKIKAGGPHWLNQLPDVPEALLRSLAHLNTLQSAQQAQQKALLRLNKTLVDNQQARNWSRIGNTLLLCVVIVWVMASSQPLMLHAMPWFGWLLSIAAGAAFYCSRQSKRSG